MDQLQTHLAELNVILNTILQNDNEQRKVAEEKLNQLKKSDPNQYSQLMVYIMHP